MQPGDKVQLVFIFRQKEVKRSVWDCAREREKKEVIHSKEREGKVSSKEKDADSKERETEKKIIERGTIVKPRQHYRLNEDLPYCHSKNKFTWGHALRNGAYRRKQVIDKNLSYIKGGRNIKRDKSLGSLFCEKLREEKRQKNRSWSAQPGHHFIRVHYWWLSQQRKALAERYRERKQKTL